MIYVNLPFGSAHGWGVLGKCVTRELARMEPLRIITEPFSMSAIGDALEFYEIQSLLLHPAEAAVLPASDGPCLLDGPLLQGIGDERLLPRRLDIRAKNTIGYTFFEYDMLKPEWIENGRRYFSRVATGSRWCTRILIEAGLGKVVTVVQGIDPLVFHPIAKERGREFFGDRFVVFSGGKFEFRKGQDVAIRAYKVLQDRHADVMLVNVWFNPWPAIFETMRASSLIRFCPRGRNVRPGDPERAG